jgi:galacturonosyltransferase
LCHLGTKPDVHPYIADSHAIIHPSYHEGMSNVLLEAASAGRPIIASDVAGCIETYEPGVTGIACKPRDAKDLERAIREFLELPYEKKAEMGRLGREKIEREFDRHIVVSKYIDVINAIIGGNDNG